MTFNVIIIMTKNFELGSKVLFPLNRSITGTDTVRL